MRNLILAGGIVLGTAASAAAGTFAAAPAEPALMAPAPAPAPMAYNWAGGYAGVGLSYGRTTNTADFDDPVFWPTGRGAGLSGLAGFNWQNGAMVYGVEGHLGLNRIRGTGTAPINGDGDNGAETGPTETELGMTASLRGRVGFAVDRTLFFGTAGIASARVSNTLFGNEDSRTASGTVLGIGVEHAINNGLHIRGDLEQYRFRGGSIFDDGIEAPFTGDVRTRANVARVSAVFRF
jgi:outer membrane immunogenic protein